MLLKMPAQWNLDYRDPFVHREFSQYWIAEIFRISEVPYTLPLVGGAIWCPANVSRFACIAAIGRGRLCTLVQECSSNSLLLPNVLAECHRNADAWELWLQVELAVCLPDNRVRLNEVGIIEVSLYIVFCLWQVPDCIWYCNMCWLACCFGVLESRPLVVYVLEMKVKMDE